MSDLIKSFAVSREYGYIDRYLTKEEALAEAKSRSASSFKKVDIWMLTDTVQNEIPVNVSVTPFIP